MPIPERQLSLHKCQDSLRELHLESLVWSFPGLLSSNNTVVKPTKMDLTDLFFMVRADSAEDKMNVP